MLSEFDLQCQELRTRIARARRRLDLRARHVLDTTTPWSALKSAAESGSWKWWAGALAVGLAGWWWARGPRLTEAWVRQLLGTTVARALRHVTRRLRILARQSQRARRAAAREADHG